jgi:hypothetical protein
MSECQLELSETLRFCSAASQFLLVAGGRMLRNASSLPAEQLLSSEALQNELNTLSNFL